MRRGAHAKLLEAAFGTSGKGSYASLADQVRDDILDRIVSGAYERGTRLTVQDVARELNVSVTPAREALKHLEYLGIVVVKPRSGTYVRQFTDEDVRETAEVRLRIESMAVERAVRKISKAEINVARELIREMERETDLPRLVRLDVALHCHIVFASRTLHLPRLMESLVHFVLLFGRYSKEAHDRRSFIAEQHSSLVDAIEARNADAAIAILSDHLQAGAEMTLEYLSQAEHST